MTWVPISQNVVYIASREAKQASEAAGPAAVNSGRPGNMMGEGDDGYFILTLFSGRLQAVDELCDGPPVNT